MSVQDEILIRDLRVQGHIGVGSREREERQEIRISLRVRTDTRMASGSDEIGDTLDYGELAREVVRLVESSAPRLVERLAHEIARICVVEFGGSSAIVRVEKPSALPSDASAGVRIERWPSDFEGEA